jgi:glycosyltransferase involved in cell wall biosynthesis
VSSWLLVAGDFTPFGGMDGANYALARHLGGADGAAGVCLVTHRASADLHALPRVTIDTVARPFGSHALGSALLARAGARAWRRLSRLSSSGVQAIVNGGNCRVPAAINWVHYVHAAYRPAITSSPAHRVKARFMHRRDADAERTALREARLIICNSRRTSRDVIECVGVDPARVAVVYYGTDPDRFSPVSDAGRAAAKTALGFDAGRPLFGFVGALGDRRKAFDTLFSAWTELCGDRRWEASLLVIGTGRELTAWQHRAQDAGLAGRIHFAGFRRDVPELLAALDVLVHPARYEAYGLAPHEAICRGVPALVSASAGVAERYPAELSDLLIDDADDAAELRHRLLMVCSERSRFQSVVQTLGATLRARTWDHMAADIVLAAGEAALVR